MIIKEACHHAWESNAKAGVCGCVLVQGRTGTVSRWDATATRKRQICDYSTVKLSQNLLEIK